MTLSVSQNNGKNQNKGSGPQRTTRFKGQCSHCGKWGHKKAKMQRMAEINPQRTGQNGQRTL